MKIGKLLASSAALTALLTILITPSAALANGVGDLYVASPAGVLEVHVATSTVVSTIPVAPSPQSVAFSPDGLTLFASTTGAKITPIDIETLDVQASLTVPGPVSALAFPAGQVLVAAMPQRRTLAFVTVHGGKTDESAQLPGPGNILAGDRREARVAVAEAGANWLEVVDPGTETMRKATVAGEIVALAIDRDKGSVAVATRNPNALLLVDLTSLATTWTVPLAGTPVAVAAMSSTIVVAGATELWKVDGKTAAPFATARKQVLVLTPSDEGSVLHAAESTGVEVFDTEGKLQRTLELSADRAPVAMAAVPRGSSLFLGLGHASPSASSKSTTPPSAALATTKPPTTSTIVDTASEIAASAPFQTAGTIGFAILFLCWLFIRWYDRRTVRAS